MKRLEELTMIDGIYSGKKHDTFISHEKDFENNAPHHYTIHSGDRMWNIDFQNGALKETGLNGVFEEHILAIAIDRLQNFQNSPYSCRENALALTHLQEAFHWLKARTEARELRNVEGTHII